MDLELKLDILGEETLSLGPFALLSGDWDLRRVGCDSAEAPTPSWDVSILAPFDIVAKIRSEKRKTGLPFQVPRARAIYLTMGNC
jgi:hypothetical protein